MSTRNWLPSDDDPAAFHRTVSWTVIGLSPFVFLGLLLFQPPTYGKLNQSNQRNWLGPKVTAKWCWMIFESPNWIWVLYTVITVGHDNIPAPNKILLGWFLFHYLHRSIVYPLRMTSDSQFPIGIMAFTVPYCATNGYLQSQGLTRFQTPAFPSDDWVSVPFVLGAILTILGFVLGYGSDQTLLRLRRECASSKKNKYQIPHGGLFVYVSCPHFLGEILEWIGFCVACQGSLASLSFAMWTAANLVPRALHHHAWYLEKFDDYPETRRALIPFLL